MSVTLCIYNAFCFNTIIFLIVHPLWHPRSTAKRIIREAYRSIDKEFDIEQGKLIVIAPSVRIKGKKMKDVRSDMLYAFKNKGENKWIKRR